MKRILNVLGGMNRGGVETWLMHVLRHIDRTNFKMDFLVHTEQPAAFDDEIRALGSRIIPCLHPSQPLRYARNFKRILREYGPYDVVHSHVHHYSGYVLWLAHQAGVPCRIAHSHSDTTSLQVKASMARRIYLESMRWCIRQYATNGVGASKAACVALWGESWEKDPRWQLLYCGLDLTSFETPINRASVRADLRISEDAFVVGHVGRFAEVKNHRFIIQIAQELIRRKPETCLLLVGDGPLRPTIEQQVREAKLANHVVFAGSRGDVPRLMMGAMDVFLFPSLNEGLGLVLIEAQAAGLRCFISDIIPSEVDVIKSLVRRLPLSALPTLWVDSIIDFGAGGRLFVDEQMHALVTESPFNISRSLRALERLYESVQEQ